MLTIAMLCPTVYWTIELSSGCSHRSFLSVFLNYKLGICDGRSIGLAGELVLTSPRSARLSWNCSMC